MKIWGTVLSVCVWSFLVTQQVKGQSCVTPNDKTEIPDIFKLSEKSYMFTVEANYNQMGKTHYITDVYDKELQRGKVTMEIDGKLVFITYFAETDEYFEAKMPGCTSKKLSSIDSQKFEQEFLGWNFVNVDPKNTLIGPSNLFRKIYLDATEGRALVGKEQGQEKVRDMSCDVWTWCYSEGKTELKIQFFFTDPTKEKPYGFENVRVPVRVIVDGMVNNSKILEYYEFVNMRLDLPKRELDETISVPATVGCKRLTDKVKPTPEMSKSSAYLEAELVYTPILNNKKDYTYATNFKVAVDADTGLVQMDFTPWRSAKDTEMVKPGKEIKRVVDIYNEIVYDTEVEDGKCKYYRPDENNQFSSFDLPDGSKVDFADWDLFFVASNNSEYHYLGETTVRGIPASIFEKHFSNDEEALTITRYFAATGVVIDNVLHEKDAPLKVILWRIDLEQGQFLGRLAVNLYNYKSTLQDKNKLFDVSNCFLLKNESKWFQMVFPLGERKASDFIDKIGFSQHNIHGVLENIGVKVLPYRLPQILFDVDQDNIYLTALLLERPEFTMDFVKVEKKTFKSDLSDVQLIGLASEAGCAKKCIEEPFCAAFTHCGALCALLTRETVDEEKDTMDSSECNFYKSRDIAGGAMPTMDEVSKGLAKAVQERKMTINLPDKNFNEMVFTAVQFRDDVAFGINGLRDAPEGTDEVRFKIQKAGGKMADGEADEGKNLGRLSLESCRQGCADKETCQSFSYCQATLDCLLSSKHGEEIASYSPSTQCITYSRVYQDYFHELQGISINHEAEKAMDNIVSVEACAKACIEEKSFTCKSFDFCAGDLKNGSMSCLLHKEHFTELKEKEHVQVTGKCGHYSRKYLSDFKQMRHQDMSKAEAGATISNVTAEDCARYCRENQGFECKAFDHCFDPFTVSSLCTLRKQATEGFSPQDICNVYIRTESKAQARVKKVTTTQTGHSKSATGGLGFLMLLIGMGVGLGGIFGFAYWKTRSRR